MQRGATARQTPTLLLLLLVLPSCQANEVPELLSVHRLDPGRAAIGDRLTVIGEGFPEGLPATITFRGDLFRPGAAPERNVRIAARAAQSGRNSLALPLDGTLERRFLGRGDSAVHTTFQGELRVAFAPSAAGTAGISGVARSVRFDVLPTSSARERPDLDVKEPSAEMFLGMTAAAEPERVGLTVTAVAPDGRAAAAGLRPGDVLLDFDGVTVLSEADLRARGGQQTAQVTVERDGRELPPLAVDVEGLAPLGAADLGRAGAALVAVSGLLALLASKVAAVLRWAPLAIDSGVGKGGGSRPRSGGAARALRSVVLPIADVRGIGVAALVVFGLVVFALVRLATGHWLLSADLDLAAGAVSVSMALLCARFADGGTRPGGRWSLRGALAALGQSLGCVAPAILALGAAVLASGRFVISEMVTDQGAAPWRWAAARNPGLLGLSVVLLASAALETGDRAPLSAAGLHSSGGQRGSTSRIVVRLVEWSYLWVMSALSVAVFFGGWRLPGVSALVQESSRALSAAGAALVVTKVGLVVLAIGAARARLSRVFVEHVAPLWMTWALPGTLVAVVVAAAWGAAFDGPRSAPLVDLCGMVGTALAGLVAGYLTFVANRRGERAISAASVNPWL